MNAARLRGDIKVVFTVGLTYDLSFELLFEERLHHLFSVSCSITNKEARLSVLVRGARQAAYSQGLLQPVQIRCKATPQIVNRVPSCKPCWRVQICSSSRMPVCNRWPILPASPRRFSSGSYEVRCVPVSDSEYYTKSDGFSGKIMGVSSRWFSISLRPLRSLRLKPLKEDRQREVVCAKFAHTIATLGINLQNLQIIQNSH